METGAEFANDSVDGGEGGGGVGVGRVGGDEAANEAIAGKGEEEVTVGADFV